MSILIDIIPIKYRKYALYAPYALVGLVLGVLFTAGNDVTVALAVYAYVGSALGLTAYANTTAPSIETEADAQAAANNKTAEPYVAP